MEFSRFTENNKRKTTMLISIIKLARKKALETIKVKQSKSF